MRAALAGSLLIALVGGYLAVHVVLRRIVFASVALAECSALGVALGLMILCRPGRRSKDLPKGEE